MNINLLKNFKDTNYSVLALGAINTGNGYYRYFVGEGSDAQRYYSGRTVSSFVLSASDSTDWKAIWKAYGYTATITNQTDIIKY